MGERKEEDSYRNFSRKDLQGLCKKYGLPANKSNSEMATSLILYLEMKNLRSRAIWEGTRRDPFASVTTELQAGMRMNSTDDQRKDYGYTVSHSGSGDNQLHNHRDGQQNNLHNGNGSATSDKASGDAVILTQLHGGSNNGAGIQENTFSSVVSSPVVAPSPTFMFDVYCEDGIQLYVDLDSSPADWIESLKAGVRLCHDVHKSMSQRFHQDIGLLCCSTQKDDTITMDPSKETNNVLIDVGSSPTTTLPDSQAQTDKSDGKEGSLSSPGLKSLCNRVTSLVDLNDAQAISSSRLESGSEAKFSGTDSVVGEETLAADSDVNAAIQISSSSHIGTCNIMGNYVPSDPKCSGMAALQGVIDGDGIHKNLSLQQTYASPDAVLKCSELSTTVCMEMQESASATLSQDYEYSPSGVRKCVDLAKDTELVQFGLVKPVQNPTRDELQTEPVGAVDQRKNGSYPSVLNSLSQDLAENRGKVDTQYGIASFFRKSDRQIREAQIHLSENAGFLRTSEAGRGTDELKRKDAAIYPCCNGGSLDLVIPKENGADCCISTNANELKEDICTNPSTGNVVDQLQHMSDTGNGREVSECLNIVNQMEKPSKGTVDTISNGERKKKRHVNRFEAQSKFLNTEAKILRSSKQFVGDVHSKRRRSSRLFTK